MSGRLFVCATPIGNLEDVSLRLLRVLTEADLVAAEDTRRTRKLLTSHHISAHLVTYNKDNEHKQADFLIDKLQAGKKVALVSDGGMPGISDPGYRIITSCINAGLEIEVIPGPSAILSALVLSGLPTARFCFEGFLPRKPGDLHRRLQDLKSETRTIVLFESPHRIHETMQALQAVVEDRPMALVREMTKLNEEVIRGTVPQVLARLPEKVLGEIVLVVQGAGETLADLDSAVVVAQDLMAEGMPKSKAAAEAASITGAKRRDVYDRLLDTGG